MNSLLVGVDDRRLDRCGDSLYGLLVVFLLNVPSETSLEHLRSEYWILW